jgi:hypothetical protein
MTRDVIIAPQTEGKGRSFTAMCLASVEADRLWDGGQTDTDEQRPVWAMFANSEQELRPFMMNLKTGRKADIGKSNYSYRRKTDKMNFLRSAGYTVTWQREVEGSVATIFLPDLFQMDPGMVDPSGASFVVLPTVEWAKAQRIEVGPLVQHVRHRVPLDYDRKPSLSDDDLANLVPTSFLFAAYLDRRTRCPLLSDARFYVQLMLACLKSGLASFSSTRSHYNQEFGVHSAFGFSTIGTEDFGFSRGVAFQATHTEIERVLAEQITIFFNEVGG